MLVTRFVTRLASRACTPVLFETYETINTIPRQYLHWSPLEIINSLKEKMGVGMDYPTGRLIRSGENMYAICAEYPELKEFIDKLGVPDTFQTWFSLTTLHVWLCLVRLRKEDKSAMQVKKTLIQLIWIDLKNRMRPFGIIRKQHSQIDKFKTQFFGSLFAYDEALMMHSDTALAAALWRNFFLSSPDSSAAQLDLAVHYIRKQLAYLDSLPSERIVGKGMPTFLPLSEENKNPEYEKNRLIYCLTWPEWDK